MKNEELQIEIYNEFLVISIVRIQVTPFDFIDLSISIGCFEFHCIKHQSINNERFGYRFQINFYTKAFSN